MIVCLRHLLGDGANDVSINKKYYKLNDDDQLQERDITDSLFYSFIVCDRAKANYIE